MKLGIIGWRGMVGQVLMERMQEEDDFRFFETTFFSTSNPGGSHPFTALKQTHPALKDAYDLEALKEMDILLSCQGGDYTNQIYPELRKNNFKGYWIDAASSLRLDKESTIVLDPVNLDKIKEALRGNKKDFIGGNCTVSLLLMALSGLFKHNAIEWISTQTYQAASGAGARNMAELLGQMHVLSAPMINNPSKNILEIDKEITELAHSDKLPKTFFNHALALNLLPWIDADLGNGQSKEEWKAQVEANKILGTTKTINIDGNCVRVSSMRSHAQALNIKLTSEIPLLELEDMIKEGNQWVRVIPNNKEDSLANLGPHHTSGKLHIPIGRLRKLSMGESYLNAFTLGDQLLWGAAEPLRRMLHIILDHKN